MGPTLSSKIVAESTYTVEGIPITIKCIKDDEACGCGVDGFDEIRAYNTVYGLYFRGTTSDTLIWDNFVNSVANNTYTARFDGGNLTITIPEKKIGYPLKGCNKLWRSEPGANAAILNAYRMQRR